MDVEPDRRRLAIAGGDLLAVVVVLAWGYTHHAGGVADLLNVVDLAETVAPFLLGYLAVAATLGAYAPRRTRTLAWSLRTVGAAWVGAVGIGLTIRTHPELTGGAAWPFGLVVLAAGLAALAAWRLAVHWLLPAAPPSGRQHDPLERQ